MSIQQKPTILFIDDETHNLNAFKYMFEKEFHIITTQSLLVATTLLEERTIHCIISDYHMPITDGATFLTAVAVRHPNTLRILVSASKKDQKITEALQEKVVHYFIEKPWKKKEIIDILHTNIRTKTRSALHSHTTYISNVIREFR